MLVVHSWGETLGRAAGAALDLVLPPRCLDCGTPVGRQAGLCAACWTGLGLLGEPCCACCGLPFAFEDAAAPLCAGCLAHPPAFARARAALAYNETAGRLIVRFKHGDATHAAGILARWMARAGAALLAEAAVIAPVPLHRGRLVRRRYNQSALLALALGRLSGVPVQPGLLQRRRATPSQAGRNRTERRRNVRGAFLLPPGRAALIGGRRVLLVDDVLTTGATVDECARVLLDGGAAAVDVLTVARVMRPLD